jgi:integrase
MRVLKRAFKVAIDEGLISRNPCAMLRPIRDTGKVEKGTFSSEQISQLVEEAEGDWKGLILAGYFTRGRLSDLARLKWRNVDLTEKFHVERLAVLHLRGLAPSFRSKKLFPI